MSDGANMPAYRSDAVDDVLEKSSISDAQSLTSTDVPSEIPLCCIATIRQHVRFNPMMVCGSCKHIIKCFTEERAFQNFLTFCRSRRRPVLMGIVDEQYTVTFRTHDRTFTR